MFSPIWKPRNGLMVYWFNGLMGFRMGKTTGLMVYWLNGLLV